MGEMYLGSIFLWPLSWVPEYLAFCNGQMLQVTNNQALFSILGNTYGGDGQTTFALPDLRSRVPIGTNMNGGDSPNLTPVNLGQKAGSENTTLVTHSHAATISGGNVYLQGEFSVSNQPATLEVPSAGSSLAAIQTTDQGDPPVTAPVLGYNNLQPNTTILGLSAQGSITGGNVLVTPAGSSNGTYTNMQPFLGMNYVMVIQGIYPTRP